MMVNETEANGSKSSFGAPHGFISPSYTWICCFLIHFLTIHFFFTAYTHIQENQELLGRLFLIFYVLNNYDLIICIKIYHIIIFIIVNYKQ